MEIAELQNVVRTRACIVRPLKKRVTDSHSVTWAYDTVTASSAPLPVEK